MLEEWSQMRLATLTSSPYTCDTNDKWQRSRGELATFDHVLSTEKQVERALDDLLADPDVERPTNSLED